MNNNAPVGPRSGSKGLASTLLEWVIRHPGKTIAIVKLGLLLINEVIRLLS